MRRPSSGVLSFTVAVRAPICVARACRFPPGKAACAGRSIMCNGLAVTIRVRTGVRPRYEATGVWPLSGQVAPAAAACQPIWAGCCAPFSRRRWEQAARREIRFRRRNEISRASPDEPLVPRANANKRQKVRTGGCLAA